MKPDWTAALVGCGRIAGLLDEPRSRGPVQTHAQAYHQHPAFKLTAVVDPKASRREALGKRWRVPGRFASLNAFLEKERVDVISLCSPSELHFDQAKQILLAQNPPRVLFMEKPVCLDEADLDRLLDLERTGRTRILVHHPRRFDPAYQKLARRIRSGVLGPLVEGISTTYGGWMNSGVHLVHTLRLLLPGEPKIANVSTAPGGRAGDDNLHLTLRWEGAPVSFRTFDERLYQMFECDLRFQRGRVQLLNFGQAIAVWETAVNDWGERILVPAEGSPFQALQRPLAHALDRIDACLAGKTPQGDPEGVGLTAVRETMRLMWRARALASAKELSHAARS
ncbi:MAG: Gfo/Idh/MocA family oxidoreductase [Candidatus Omnitrophica bacterium]|nr:Gfo/Idh/MocA family oxidoreductase [Candidatus Omnitrophota bacterium]